MSLSRSAEKATLGALMLRPEGYEDVRQWLQPTDFDGSAERATYDSIERLNGRDIAATAQAVERDLVHEFSAHELLADGPFLYECLSTCPDPSRAGLYGRMVLEFSIQRRISDLAADLRARTEAAWPELDLNVTFNGVDWMRRRVEELHQREATADRSHSPTPIMIEPLPPPTAQLSPDPTTEMLAVTALTDQPHLITTVSEWLRVEDFTDRRAAVVYATLQQMHQHDEPIDRLTVGFQLAQNTQTSEPEVGWTTSSNQSRDGIILARRVLRASVYARVVNTTEDLERVSSTPGRPTTAVAYQRLNALWPDQRRLVRSAIPGAPKLRSAPGGNVAAAAAGTWLDSAREGSTPS